MTKNCDSAPHGLTRRAFIAQSAVAAGALVFPGCASHSPNPRSGIIDTHIHFYDPTRPQGVPWPPKDDPVLYRRVMPSDYERLAQPMGVIGAVVVEASPWEEDNQWVLELAQNEKLILGLVGHLKPGRPGFRENLDRFAANRLFRGIRTGGWAVSVEPGRNDYLKDLQLVADRGLVLDVLIGPEKLPAVAQLSDALPTLPIVINHVANLRIDGGTPPVAWTEGMRACARHRNVHCKVSGLVEGTGRIDGHAPTDLSFYRPVLDTVWECFGEDRVLYGSNWPVSERFASYQTLQAVVADYAATKGRTPTEKCFHRNARRVYRLS